MLSKEGFIQKQIAIYFKDILWILLGHYFTSLFKLAHPYILYFPSEKEAEWEI